MILLAEDERKSTTEGEKGPFERPDPGPPKPSPPEPLKFETVDESGWGDTGEEEEGAWVRRNNTFASKDSDRRDTIKEVLQRNIGGNFLGELPPNGS